MYALELFFPIQTAQDTATDQTAPVSVWIVPPNCDYDIDVGWPHPT